MSAPTNPNELQSAAARLNFLKDRAQRFETLANDAKEELAQFAQLLKKKYPTVQFKYSGFTFEEITQTPTVRPQDPRLQLLDQHTDTPGHDGVKA